MIDIVLEKRLSMYKNIKKFLLLSGLTLTLSSCNKEQEEIEKTIQDNQVEYATTLEKEVKELPRKLEVKTDPQEKKMEEPKIEKKEITISAVGDCTLGTDTHFGYPNSLPYVLENNNQDFSYFFNGVYDVVSKDDLTIANLETTFTDASEEFRVDKKFNFKGEANYTNILTSGSIEAVNLANNHTFDYGEKGYNDTIQNLENASILYFGYENYCIFEVDGIEIGFAGITGWDEVTAKENTKKALQYFQRQNVDLILVSYHWGVEREYRQNNVQENIARFAIDNGADLVLGHHPHVLQGIEKYDDKYIVYSLGNFVFGGNKNPSDKDTMIFQETFYYENDVLIDTSIKIIPCSLSSRTDLNDYQPTLLEGEEQKRVLKKVLDNSTNLEEID